MFRKFTLAGVFLAFIVIIINAYLRLYSNYQGAFTVETTAIIQQTGYYAVMGLAGIAVILISLSWRERHCRIAAVFGAWLLLLLSALKFALGLAIVRTHGLPVVISMQVLTSMLSLWLIYWLYLRSDKTITLINPRSMMAKFTRFASLLLVTQIVLGLLVSNYSAISTCHGFPQCNGEWIPLHADYTNLFVIIEDLINGYQNQPLTLESKLALNYSHRVFGSINFVVLSLILFKATAIGSARHIKLAGIILGCLLFIQLFLSITELRFGFTLWTIIGHNILAQGLMLALITIGFYSRYGIVSEIKPPVIDTTTVEIENQSVVSSYQEPSADSLYLRLKNQLHRTRSGLNVLFTGLPLGQKAIDDDLLEEIEASLLMADIGIDATTMIINRLTQKIERHQLNDSAALMQTLKQELLEILKTCDQPLVIPKQDKPFVILVVGVNGAGKTTTIGKLANRLQAQGHSVMLAAGDTFRAAAVEQLQVWGERNHIPVVAQHTGADSASVIFDALQSAQAKKIDVLIADTAGRLQTKSNLMDELKKIKRIMSKLDESAPHEVLLVLDAGTGQNALSQAKLFNEAVNLTGLVLTKLDGTAKGGVIFALAKHSAIPIRYIGIGESIEDLQDFHAEQFVSALFVRD